MCQPPLYQINAKRVVEMDMYCVTTRFRLKHFWQLLPMYLSYWRMQRDLKVAPGLIRYAFLFEGPRTLCTFSIWESEEAIKTFSNVHSHITALRKSKLTCQAIWSAYWSLDAISKHASSWHDVRPWPPLTCHPKHSHRLIPISEKDRTVKDDVL